MYWSHCPFYIFIYVRLISVCQIFKFLLKNNSILLIFCNFHYDNIGTVLVLLYRSIIFDVSYSQATLKILNLTIL
jgi:hypothetical protein